jgi:hypothetical protein
MWGFASLYSRQGQIEDAGIWYSKALSGYQKVFGNDHSKCQVLRDKLAALNGERDQGNAPSERVVVLEHTALDRERDQSNAPSERVLVPEHTHLQTIVKSNPPQNKPASRRHKLLRKLGLKHK